MKILILAGEESGAIYARKLRDAVSHLDPRAEIRGYEDYGFEIGDLAVFGIWSVLKKIGYFLRVKHTMMRAIAEWKPDVICTIDYPGMNLRLAAYAKSLGVKAVHVVCPQVWAWHQGRIPKIEAGLDKLCCFLPFEPAIFKPGFAEFVGHPLVDEVGREATSRKPSTAAQWFGRVLAILPGSRIGEIEKHMPTLLATISQLNAQLKDKSPKVVIPAANEKAQQAISRQIARCGRDIGDIDNVEVVRGGARQVLALADCAVVASGTATFEAALVNCPFVLVYRVSAVLAAFLRHAITGVKHVGLINVIAEKAGKSCPMPEYLQENFTVGNLLRHLVPWLTDEDANKRARKALLEAMSLLRSDGDSIAKIARNLI